MKKYLLIAFLFISYLSHAQIGDKDISLRAIISLSTDSLFIYRDTIISVLDLSYNEWSSNGSTWRKNYVLGDRYMRISNDAKHTWVTIDLYDRYWVNSGSTIYNNQAYGTKVLIDTTGVIGNYDLFVRGNTSSKQYFLRGDTLSLKNVYAGSGVNGYVLTKNGSTATWTPQAGSSGNTARNVGVDGYGVFEDSLSTELQFRNIASADTSINVTLEDSTIYISWDGTGRVLTAGVGLSGGGDLGANRTINLYVPELPEMSDTVDYAADWLVLNDISTGTHYKIHPEDLLAVLGEYTDSIGIGLDGNKFYLKEPQTVSETSDNVASGIGHYHRFNMNSFELIDLGDVSDTPTAGQYLKWNGTNWVTDTPTGAGSSFVSLYIDSALVESDITKLNVITTDNVNASYAGDGGLVLSVHDSVSIASESVNKASIDSNQVLTIYDQTQITVDPNEYGALYNWYVTQEDIAPDGWHVPTYTEFKTLFENYGITFDVDGFSIELPNNLNVYLQEKGSAHWKYPYDIGLNQDGFNVVGAGVRGDYIEGGTFFDLKTNCSYFTSTEYENDANYAWTAVFGGGDNSINNNTKSFGLSLRLIKDDSTDPGTVEDYDGNVYPTVKIGDQVWMAENLRVTHLNDGTPIDGPDFTNDEWAALTTPAYCYYKQPVLDMIGDVNLQKVTDAGNTVYKETAVESDSTYLWRTSITQTTGSATNRLSGYKNYTTYSGAENQNNVSGIVSYVNNTGTGLVTNMAGSPVNVFTSSNSSATNIWGTPVIIRNYGKFNKLMGLYSWIDNYSRNATNNDAYGTTNTFRNYGLLDGYSGFQLDFYNYGVLNDANGMLIGMYLTDSVTNVYGLRLGGGAHNWTGDATNSYGIYADRSIDRGTTNSYFINSESKSLSKLAGNFQLDTLSGDGDRLVVVDSTGLFKYANHAIDSAGITLTGVDYADFRDSSLVTKEWVLSQTLSGNKSTQTLVGTTPYWNVSNGENAFITLTGTTTITMANLTDGMEGSLYVTNGGSTLYRITFAGYNVEIYPSVWYSGDEVAVSGSTKKDVFSYKYFGGDVNKLVISGALDIK